MDYDNEVLGVENREHPANEHNYIFESDDLDDCLDHYKKTGDLGPLENAINTNRKIMYENKKIIADVMVDCETSNRSDLSLKLWKIKL